MNDSQSLILSVYNDIIRYKTVHYNTIINRIKDITGRRFIMKGVRPKVELRRETPPSFLLNYDVPLDVDKVSVLFIATLGALGHPIQSVQL